MRKRLGLTPAEVADRLNVRQERVSAIGRAKVDVSELRTLAAYIAALADAWRSLLTWVVSGLSSADPAAISRRGNYDCTHWQARGDQLTCRMGRADIEAMCLKPV